MSTNADFLRLRDMLDRAERIARYLEGKSQAEFLSDGQLQDSVLHCFLILGEAASQITEPTQVHYSQLPWRSMVESAITLCMATRDWI